MFVLKSTLYLYVPALSTKQHPQPFIKHSLYELIIQTNLRNNIPMNRLKADNPQKYAPMVTTFYDPTIIPKYVGFTCFLQQLEGKNFLTVYLLFTIRITSIVYIMSDLPLFTSRLGILRFESAHFPG